jgi:ribonuclease G
MFGWLFKKTSKPAKMKRGIVINSESLETRVAVMEEGRLEEFQVEYASQERIVGSIFKGKIQNLEHDLQAAFVDIGLKRNAFLHYWDMIPDDEARLEYEEGGGRSSKASKRRRISNEEIQKRFPSGTEIIVQVAKGPIGTKGPRVTANLSIPGRYLVLMPGTTMKGVSRKIGDDMERQRLKKILARLPMPPDTGLIARTAANDASQRAFVRDLRSLTLSWEELQRGVRELPAPCCVYQEPDLVERVVRDWLTEEIDLIVIDNKSKFERIREIAGHISRSAKNRVQLYEGDLPVFEHYDVEPQLEKAFQRRVALKSGGYVISDETEALVAVDVNTGRHKGSGSQEEVILAVNMEAVDEVARQLRLRNIGGLVVIDLIDMKSRKHQSQVFKAMKAALKRDRARTNVLPISELGLMEMTRQRVEESIFSSMYADCPYCKGRGNVKSTLGMSVDIQRQISSAIRKHRKDGGNKDLQIVVHPTVMERLRKEDEQFLLDLESRFGGHLGFKSDPSRHMEYFSISNPATGEVYYSTSDK